MTGLNPLFQPLERGPDRGRGGGRLSDRVAGDILGTIVERGLQVGDRLPTEREMAGQFQVSRTVVREALRSLVSRGLVDARPSRGMRIAAVDASLVTEAVLLYFHGHPALNYGKLNEVREMLECETAALAAERATPQDVALMAAVLDGAERDVRDFEAGWRADLAFHGGLARATGNEMWVALLEAVSSPLAEIRRLHIHLPDRNAAMLSEHREVLNCVASHDPNGARTSMRCHLESTWRIWGPQVAHLESGALDHDRLALEVGAGRNGS